MNQPYKILTGEPGETNEGKYRPQTRHYIGQARSFSTFLEMCESLVCVGKPAIKKKLGYFVPGGLLAYAQRGVEYDKSAPEGRRCNGNIGDLHFVAFDVDELHSLELDVLIESLVDSELEAFIYHTPSSTSDKPRVRILVNIDEPLSSETDVKANLMIDVACAIWGEPTGEFCWNGVKFDRTAFREAQYMIRPHDGAECEYIEGQPVHLDDLPEYHHNWQLPGVYDSEYGQGEFDDADVADWREWATGRGLRIEGDKIIVICPNNASHTSNTDGTNSTAIKLPRPGHPEARFMCLHDNCDRLNRNQRDTMSACGVPEALLPDAHGARQVAKSGFTFTSSAQPTTNTPEQRAAALALMGISHDDAAPKRERARTADTGTNTRGKWDGKCNDYRDKRREEIAGMLNMQLWQLPPDVKAVTDKEGTIRSYKSFNTPDNLEWLLEVEGWSVARNAMTWEFEMFDRNGIHITRSADETDSHIIGAASRRELPDAIYDKHIRAIASRKSFHPVEKLLHGKRWDGVPRVEPAIECLQTADDAYTSALMRAFLVGAISAIDDGSVEMKFCPVLFSKANDWHKSQYVSRLFAVTDRAFKGGIPVPDPTDKDSLNNVILTWGGELGELGGMGKRDTETLKAWLPQSSDEWRPPYARNTVRKPRQSVYIGTVNRDDFIKDPTLASRFPVIQMTGPVHIDRLNNLLGWTYDGNRATLTDAEKLIQFWLEVRQMKADGESYILPNEVQDKVREVGEAFTDKGGFYSLVLDALNMQPNENVNHDWQTATRFCGVVNLTARDNRYLGRALKMLHDEGQIERRSRMGCFEYWLPTSI